MTDVSSGALEASAAGWAVFPCRIDKRPFVARGFRAATTDPDVIQAWWARWPRASIGAAVPSSLAVVDVDGDHGEATLAGLEAKHGCLPPTLTCLTGGGGRHLYMLHPGGELRQGAGVLGHGLDTRMPRKGYVLLPPSPHPSGRSCKWADATVPPAPMPLWLIALLRRRPQPARTAVLPTRNLSDAYVRAALQAEVANVVTASEGTGNDTLYIAAVKLGSLVGTGRLAARDVFAALLDAAHCNGYVASDGDRAALATIRSGLEWGRSHPRVAR